MDAAVNQAWANLAIAIAQQFAMLDYVFILAGIGITDGINSGRRELRGHKRGAWLHGFVIGLSIGFIKGVAAIPAMLATQSLAWYILVVAATVVESMLKYSGVMIFIYSMTVRPMKAVVDRIRPKTVG